MAQFYVPRYDTGSGNPWAGAASAYGNELDRLGSLQQQGMQDTSQLPMKLYQSFLQGYQDQQSQQQAQAEFEMRQQQMERQNRLAELQQQKADEAEAFRRDQLKQQGALKGTQLLAETQRDQAMNYTPELRGSYKSQFVAALMAKGMGETEANAAAESYLPSMTETKYESKVHPETTDLEGAPQDWSFKVGDQPISVLGAPMEAAPEDWSFSPGSVQTDQYTGSRILEAKRKEARDAQLAAQAEQSQAYRDATLAQKDRQLQQQWNIAMARMGQGATKSDIAAQAKMDKEETKRKDEKIDALSKHEALSSTLDDLSSLAQALYDDKDLKGIIGIPGKLGAMIPNSKSYDLMASIKKLSSKAMIATIEKMKSQSKTGATGFGQLSNQEGEILRTALANLDTLQSYDKLRSELLTIINTARGAKDRSFKFFNMKYGEQGKTEVKRQRGTGPDAGKIKIIYSDGTEEIIQGGR